MIRKILVPVRGDGKGENVLAHAALLARRFSAHIVVSYCKARPEDMLPFGVPVPSFVREQLINQSEQLGDVEEEKLRGEFLALAKKFDLKISDTPDGKVPSAEWIARSGKQVDIIKQYGRLADLICVAQPDRDRNLGANTLKSALFHTGRPVMMCVSGNGVPEQLGAHIAIAWNGSTEAARAVALCAEIIACASQITILSAGDDQIHGSSTEDLQDYLKLRGSSAEVVRFEPKSNIGTGLLEQSRMAGADLMIMGAYRDSHERETIFGGNTQTVVDKANMPVVFVH